MDKVQAAIFKTLGYEPWASQLEFHESGARFKFLAAGSRYGKSFSGAMEVLTDILKPNTRGWICGPCVDDKTEILTQRGWLDYKELKIGDMVLTLNMEGKAEWQVCQKIHITPSEGDMISIEQRGHSSLTTIAHRWITGYTTCNTQGKGCRTLGYRIKTISEMKANDFVLASAPVLNLPTVKKYDDAFVELIGWYWTEGEYSKESQGCRIAQNEGDNANRISEAARKMFGEPSTNLYSNYNIPQWTDWKGKINAPEQGNLGFNISAAKLFREIAPKGVISSGFIMSLTKGQLDLLLETSILADGHERNRTKRSGKVYRERVIIQKSKKRIDQIQVVAHLLGYQTVLRYNKTRDDYTLGINERNRFWIGGCKKKEIVYYKGDVWCPQTENGTWFARRNGTVYSTGNSYTQPSKEFRYIYDALVNKLGFKPKRELNVAFTTPGPQALLFPWGSEILTVSEQNQDSMLGEEIDWLILSEGSRLKEETYDMYLRARLGSRCGRVIVPTTPHGYNWLYKRFYIPYQEGDSNYWAKVGIKVTENPKFDKEEYERAKKELPEDVFAEQYDGEFIAWSGLIFKRFSRQRNVIAPIPIPSHWPVYCAIDPHPSTPVGILWLTVDEYGTWYICHEMFHPDLTIPEIAKRLKNIEKKCPVTRYLIDPNAKIIDKLRGQTVSVQMQLRREGIPVIEANNKFEGAWYKICEALTPRATFGDEENLKPKLFVFSDCKKTIEEFEGYTWENEKSGKAHLMDCLKYIVNDNPSRALREEEEQESKAEEEQYLRGMNKVTGY